MGILKKIKKMFWRLKMRKMRKIRHVFTDYGHKIQTLKIPQYGVFKYARWLHPASCAKIKLTRRTLDHLRTVVKEGDTVIDIGAHAGDTTLPLAIVAGKSGHALAFEPNPYVFKILDIIRALNEGAVNIIPRCFAATNEDGEFEFYYSDASFCNGGDLSGLDNEIDHKYPLKVIGKNLNLYLKTKHPDLLQKLTFIKIDTEGHDRDVILSLMDIILKYRPVIRTEVMNRLSLEEAVALYDTLIEMKYDLFQYDEGCYDLCGDPITRENVKRDYTYDIIAIN